MKDAFLTAMLGLVCAVGTVRADTPLNTEITDYKLAELQMAADSPDLIDGPANVFKFIKVFFTSGVDLGVLARQQDRDFRVAVYGCQFSTMHSIHDSYETDRPVYDAYGKVTRDRVAKVDSSLDRFKGVYYFLLPTSQRYAMGSSYVFEMPYNLYSHVQDMCFETPGSASTFFSNEVKISSDSIKAVLKTPQGGPPHLN